MQAESSFPKVEKDHILRQFQQQISKIKNIDRLKVTTMVGMLFEDMRSEHPTLVAQFQSNAAQKTLQIIYTHYHPQKNSTLQPAEAFWHPVGCQCRDDDCMRGTLIDTGTWLHPDDCQCSSCLCIAVIGFICSILSECLE
jgi:hypothetical protein